MRAPRSSDRALFDQVVSSLSEVRAGKLGVVEDESFDIVFSKDFITEAPNKEDIFLESYCVLRPGGWIAMSDWYRDAAPFTPEMKKWMKQVGMVLEMTTLDETANLLRKIGFVDVLIEGRNEWYQNYSKRELERMAGKDRHGFERILGKEQTEEWIEGITIKTNVVAQGQLRPGHLRAQKS